MIPSVGKAAGPSPFHRIRSFGEYLGGGKKERGGKTKKKKEDRMFIAAIRLTKTIWKIVNLGRPRKKEGEKKRRSRKSAIDT